MAALGAEEQETEAEHVRAYVGAILLAEGLAELKSIRRALTQEK